MTLSTLRFGGTASNITNKIAPNIKKDENSKILDEYKRDVSKLRHKLNEVIQKEREEAEAVKQQLKERIANLNDMLLNQSK